MLHKLARQGKSNSSEADLQFMRDGGAKVFGQVDGKGNGSGETESVNPPRNELSYGD